MLRLLLKHVLYEQCINIVFETISNNFADKPPVDESVRVPGVPVIGLRRLIYSDGDLREPGFDIDRFPSLHHSHPFKR